MTGTVFTGFFSSLIYLFFFGGADLVFYLILYLFFYYTVSTPQGSLHLATLCKYNVIYPKHSNKTNWHIRRVNKIKCKSKLSRVNTISGFCQNKTSVWTNLFFPLKRPNDQSQWALVRRIFSTYNTVVLFLSQAALGLRFWEASLMQWLTWSEFT